MLVAGGFCYARIPHPSWVARDPFVRAIRAGSAHEAVGLIISAVGLIVLTWAWWGLRRFAADDVLGVRAVRIAALSWAAPLLLAPPLFSSDGWSYVATGFLTGRGLSPYVYTPSILPAALRSGVTERWLDTPSPYGPLALGWGGASSRITDNPWLLLVSYRVFAGIGLALLAWAVPHLALRSGRHPGAASWLALASPFVIAHGIGGLHNDLVVAGLGAAALAVATRDRWVLGAVLAGAAAAVKLPGGLIAVGVVLLSLPAAAGYLDRIRRGAQVLAVAAATVLGLGVVTGVGTGWISSLSVPTSIPGKLSLSRDLGSLLGMLPDQHPSITISLTQTFAVIVMAIASLLLVLRHRLGNDTPVLVSIGLLMLGVTLFSPAVHYWYFLWCLPLLACVALGPTARGAAFALVAALGLTAFMDPSLHAGPLTDIAVWTLALAPFAGYAAVRLRDRVGVEEPAAAV